MLERRSFSKTLLRLKEELTPLGRLHGNLELPWAAQGWKSNPHPQLHSFLKAGLARVKELLADFLPIRSNSARLCPLHFLSSALLLLLELFLRLERMLKNSSTISQTPPEGLMPFLPQSFKGF